MSVVLLLVEGAGAGGGKSRYLEPEPVKREMEREIIKERSGSATLVV